MTKNRKRWYILQESLCYILYVELSMRMHFASLVPYGFKATKWFFLYYLDEKKNQPTDFMCRFVTIWKTWIHHFIPDTKQHTKKWKKSWDLTWTAKEKIINILRGVLTMEELGEVIIFGTSTFFAWFLVGKLLGSIREVRAVLDGYIEESYFIAEFHIKKTTLGSCIWLILIHF